MKSVIQAILVTLSHQMDLRATLEMLMDSGNVNVFNFDEPMHGDIYGFVL